MLPSLKIRKIELILRPMTAANATRKILAVCADIFWTRNAKARLIANGEKMAIHLKFVPQINLRRSGLILIPRDTRPLTARAKVM
jgi:hypothetical protein